MADDLNVCAFVGRLTRDAEVKTTSSGYTIHRFDLAVGKRIKDKQTGEWTTRAIYLPFQYWSKGNVGEYLKKGRQVSVQASADMDEWEDKSSGAKRSRVYFNVVSLGFVGGKSEQNSASSDADKVAKKFGGYATKREAGYAEIARFVHTPESPKAGEKQDANQIYDQVEEIPF